MTTERELSRRDAEAIEKLGTARRKILEQLSQVIVGQREVIDELLISLFSRGHCLLEGVPGLAKTLMVSTLARTLDLSFSRVQFTPDLMPADITGIDIIEEDRSTGSRDYRFLEGPLFSNVVLADEINRTPPKTQAALLEAMQERQVTISGSSRRLSDEFFVIATQNPVDQEGTYPLPEAQLDRFLVKLTIDYPSKDDELEILRRDGRDEEAPAEEAPVIDRATLRRARDMVSRVYLDDMLARYIVTLVDATRRAADWDQELAGWLLHGASPRATLALARSSRALAWLRGRDFVEPDDIVSMARDCLAHRIALDFPARAEGIDATRIVDRLVDRVPIP